MRRHCSFRRRLRGAVFGWGRREKGRGLAGFPLGPLLVLLLILGAGLGASEGTVALGRKEVLAAVLAKVPPYVRWPEAAFEAASDPVVIGFLGDDPTEGLLGSLVKGMRIGERDVVVRTFANPDQVAHCQMLFVPAARSAEWEGATRASSPHLLVVGENEEVEKIGGTLCIVPADRKLHVFVANARKAQLEIDPRLLKLAKVHR